MGEYRVRFLKRLCNDVGLQRICLQAIVNAQRARSAERALQAAQKRFERSKRNADWRLYADFCELKRRDLSATIRLLGNSAFENVQCVLVLARFAPTAKLQ
jgi:hypothetical protein